MPTARVDQIVDTRPTRAEDLKVGDLVDGQGRVTRNDPLMTGTGPGGFAREIPGRRWVEFDDGTGQTGGAGTFDDDHHFYLITDDRPPNPDGWDEAAWDAANPGRTFPEMVKAAMVSSDDLSLADIEVTDHQGDSARMTVWLDGHRYRLTMEEDRT